MRLLIVTGWFPYPPINGAKIRSFNLIRQLANLAELDLIAIVHTLEADQIEASTQHMLKFCRSVKAIPIIAYRPGETPAYKKLLDPLPDSIRMTYNTALEQAVAEAWKNTSYNAAIVSESSSPGPAAFPIIHQGIHPLILDSLELGGFRPQGSLFSTQRWRAGLTWWKNCNFSKKILRKCDAYTVASQTEYELFEKLAPRHVPGFIVPNALDPSDYQEITAERIRNQIVFTGSFAYPVNYKAVEWFTQQVWQHIPGRDELHLLVTGKTAGANTAVLQQACPQISFTGFVADIKPLIAQSSISIVPILTGGSTRLKIIEAMLLGTPVVSTRIGAEGLEVSHGENILLADTPLEFAQAIDQLLHNDELWLRLSQNGRDLVARRYNVAMIGPQFQQIFQRIGMR